jgi:hypothetical protein
VSHISLTHRGIARDVSGWAGLGHDHPNRPRMVLNTGGMLAEAGRAGPERWTRAEKLVPVAVIATTVGARGGRESRRA